MRYAGMVSLVAFVMGYDPTRFEGLLAHIPAIGRKSAEDGTTTSDGGAQSSDKGGGRNASNVTMVEPNLKSASSPHRQPLLNEAIEDPTSS